MSDRPVLQGEIVGRRGWNIGRTPGAQLRSAVQCTVWFPGINTAGCLATPHPAPHGPCHCGLYAYYDRDGGYGDVRGLITAWGDIQLHPDGFRAQHAQVAALVDDGQDGLPELARAYRVPLITREQYGDDRFVSEFGEIVPLEMRPAPQPVPPELIWAPPYRSRRRDQGIRAIYGLVGLGGLISLGLHSAWPIVATLWIVAGMTFTTVKWPDWWDAA